MTVLLPELAWRSPGALRVPVYKSVVRVPGLMAGLLGSLLQQYDQFHS